MVIIDIVTDDKRLKNDIIKLFSKRESIIISDNGINVYGNKYLINISGIQIKNSKKKIVFMSKNNYKGAIIKAEDICIVNSTDKKALQFLKCCHSPAITCGFNTSDTLTFSSLSKEPLIALQRAVEAADDTIIEPKEFKSEILSQNKYYELMLNALLLII